MKRALKIAFVIAFMTVLICLSIMPVFATGIDPKSIKGVNVNTNSMQTIGGQVVTIVSVAGSIIAVVVLVILGIKYMMGSAEEKAEYKKTLLPYIVGAAFVFAASALAGIIYNFASGIGA